MDERATQTLRFGSVVTGTGAVLSDATVVVERGRIVDVSSGGASRSKDVHRPDQTLIPGFVDAHVHLVFGYEPTHDQVRRGAEDVSLEELTARAAVHAAECVRGGVTTARDCGDRDFVTVAIRDAISEGRLPGPRLTVAGPPVTIESGHLHWCGGVVSGPADFDSAIGRLHGRGVNFVKLMASGGKMTVESDPSRPQFTAGQVGALTRLAHKAGLPVAAHAHSVETIRFCTSAGVDSIEHCSWKTTTGDVALVDDVAADIVRRDIAVVLTMAGIQRALLPGASVSEQHREAAVASSETGTLVGDLQWAREMLADGARIVIASDAGVRLTPFVDFADSVRCGIEALDISAARAIELATIVPANVLGLADIVGSIEVGKVADLVSLDGLVTDSSRALPVVATTWQAGRVVSA